MTLPETVWLGAHLETDTERFNLASQQCQILECVWLATALDWCVWRHMHLIAATHVSLVLFRESAPIRTGSLSRATWLNRVSLDAELLFIPDKKANAISRTRLAFLRLMETKL